MKKIIKNAAILTLITLVSGLLLGLVYEITKEPIAKVQEEAKQEAYALVLEDAASFEDVEDFSEEDTQKELDELGYTTASVNSVAIAKDASGQEIGYVITVTSHEGYGGDIQFTVGILSDGTVKGVEFLSIEETAGLGMKAKEPEFKGQFKDRQVSQFAYTKSGAKDDTEIDAISGATVTTNAVTNGVNTALAYFQMLGGGQNE